MSDNESFMPDRGRVRSQAEIDGELLCVRCRHIERLHTEAEGEEEGSLYCHAEDCDCPWFVSEFGIS
jgi:phosphatidylserine decarboxylase